MAFTPYVIPYLVTAAMLLAFFPVAWRRRLTRGSGLFVLLILSSAFWSVGNGFEMALTALPAKMVAANLEYFAIVSVPVLWFLFALEYTGHMGRLRSAWPALLLVPLVTIILVWTTGHQLMRYDIHLVPGTPCIALRYGPWFYVQAAYSYVLIAAGAGVLLRGVTRGHSLFRAQSLLLFVACLMPFVANVVHVLDFGPVKDMDLTPPMFGAGVLVMALAVYRYHMFELVPAAREAVIETMPDALLVMDQMGRVVDANPAAARLFAAASPLIGRSASSLVPATHAPLLTHPVSGAPASVIELPDAGRLLELRLTPLRDGAVVSGWLAVLHDVTERETTVRELQAALAEVRTLSGLIPICAACKKVRNDDGYWQQVESFVSAHSNAEFTHGICPECAARLYPEQNAALDGFDGPEAANTSGEEPR